MHLQALYPDSRSVLVPVIISHNQSDYHELSRTISRLECISVRTPAEILFPITTMGQSQK